MLTSNSLHNNNRYDTFSAVVESELGFKISDYDQWGLVRKAKEKVLEVLCGKCDEKIDGVVDMIWGKLMGYKDQMEEKAIAIASGMEERAIEMAMDMGDKATHFAMEQKQKGVDFAKDKIAKLPPPTSLVSPAAKSKLPQDGLPMIKVSDDNIHTAMMSPGVKTGGGVEQKAKTEKKDEWDDWDMEEDEEEGKQPPNNVVAAATTPTPSKPLKPKSALAGFQMGLNKGEDGEFLIDEEDINEYE